MLSIGIDSNTGLVYERNDEHWGRGVWPTPIITPARIVFPSEGPLEAESSNTPVHQALRFREDHYDPIARVRRGRFYTGDGIKMQPAGWKLQAHPGQPLEMMRFQQVGLVVKSLDTFRDCRVGTEYLDGRCERPLVLLGRDKRFTIHTIIDVEVTAAGEDLVTLKARSALGLLPVLNERKIPKKYSRRVQESLNGFVDEAHRAAPVSVIDRARDAASQILIAHYKVAKDLSDLAKKLEEDQRIVAASAAKIIARLHARAKPSEQEKRRTLPQVREQDAQLAIQCVGTILCELGWAEWA